MSDPQPPAPEARNDADDSAVESGALAQAIISSGPDSPDRHLMRYFFIALAVNFAALMWAAARTAVPEYVRPSLNVFFYLTVGGSIAWVSIRAFMMYAYRIVELYVIILVLSLGVLVALDAILSFSIVGLAKPSTRLSEQRLLEVFEVGLFTCSILLFGGALALRQCHVLGIEKTFSRIVAIVSGMLSVPAAAGVAVFPVLILRDVIAPGPEQPTHVYLLLWLASIAATVVNAINLIKMMTLKVEIEERETKWKDG